MTFRVLDALPVLTIRLGETINKVPSGARAGLENQKAMGFITKTGKVLALDVYKENMDRVKLWIEPSFSISITGVVVHPTKSCHDLNRKVLSALSHGKSVYLEVENIPALNDLLDWYT